ncbi:MAG: dienelactone hydrolase family protein [Chloroflexi bacterium]|nr:dienelactone hydrolase family protein [Chloroflexota bacterium]
MPIYDPTRIEYPITNGHISIVMDGGAQLPAYWSHPARGNRFPGIALIHDWWGVNEGVRRIAHLFAQMGYYVIVPDLYGGRVAANAQEAMALVQALGDGGYPRIHAALTVLEKHHQCNADVAAVGLGMGGSLAFEAALTRPDLEAAVAFGGFPQRYFGRFAQSHAPILAIYGSREPYITAPAVAKLRAELDKSPQFTHQVAVIEGAGHEFFNDNDPISLDYGRQAWRLMTDFLEKYLQGPLHPSLHHAKK